MREVVGLAAIAALTVSASAHATPSARLVYARSAEAASCPDEAALRKAVSARFGYDPFFAWAKQTVVVQISRGGGRYTARVQLVDDRGLARGTREISSDDDQCSELFDAAALAISIALDAAAQTQSLTAAASTVDTTSPPPPADAPAPSPLAAAAPPPSVAPAPADGASSSPRHPTGPLRIGVDALLAGGIGPNAEPGIDVFAQLRRGDLSAGIELEGAMGLSASVPLSASYPSATGTLTSTLFAATASPCAHFGVGFGCALGQIGWLGARGSDVSFGRADGALFLAAGARVGVEWPLSEWFFLRVRGDLVADLTPASVSLDGQTVWKAPPVAGMLGAGVGTRLP